MSLHSANIYPSIGHGFERYIGGWVTSPSFKTLCIFVSTRIQKTILLTLKRGWRPKWPTVGCIGLMVSVLHRIRQGSELLRSRHYLYDANLIFQIIFGAHLRCRGRDILCLLCISMYSGIIR